MSTDPFISILVAEDNDVSRQLLTGILEAKGYKVYGAIDGESAIKVIQDHTVDMALVDVNMAPTGGLEFAKYLVTQRIKLPVVLVTGDDSSDLLTQASNLGVAKVIQKPVQPDRILQTVQRLAQRLGLNPEHMGAQSHETQHSPEELMHRTIEQAVQNVKSGKGGPFAAIVADENGKILGQGANRHAARIDPTAHAEVMAIRQAAENIESASLSGCTLFCSSYPTKMGQALIESVGIQKVYYGLTHEETGLPHKETSPSSYEQLGKDEAQKLFKS